MKANLNIPDFLWHYAQIMLLVMFTLPGKFTVMSPMITAMTPGLVTADLCMIQIIAGFTFFKYYAHGNLFMMLSLIWTMK